MRFRLAAICGLLGVAGVSATAFANQSAENERARPLDVAASMMTNDWVEVARQVRPGNVTQDPAAPLLESAGSPDIDAFATFLSTCRFTALAGDWGPGERQSLGESDAMNPPTKMQLMWLCPRFRLVEAVVSETEGNLKVRFKRSDASTRDIGELRRSGRNAEIVEGLAARSLVEPDFKVGRAPRSEPEREGEPSEQELNEIALQYISVILDPRGGDELPGLDYLNFASMSWSDRESRQFRTIPFAEVRDRLRECRLFEGWPRRYDRDGERVFAFHSGWRCLGPTGPYSTTVFLEMKDGAVAGGRFMENDGTDRPMTASVVVRPRAD